MCALKVMRQQIKLTNTYLYNKSVVNSGLSVYVANLSFAVFKIRPFEPFVNRLDPRYLKSLKWPSN